MTIVRSLGVTDRVVPLESRKSIAIPLADLVSEGRLEIYPEVEEKGYFSVQFRGRELHLTAGPYIGLIPINSRVTIEVRPKLPVSNLGRVIDISQRPLEALVSTQRFYASQPETTISIIEFLARNLLISLQEVETHGLYKIYLPHTENSSQPRGRINFRQTALLNYSNGIYHKVYSTFYEQTVDGPYNRILKHALWFLAQRLCRVPRRDRKLMHDLNLALNLFDSVTLDPSQQLIEQVDRDLKRHRVPSNRRYYERALRVAVTILAGKGISLVGHGQEIELSSYIVNFEDLFEAYLRQVLRMQIQNLRPDVRVRDGNHEAKKRLFDDSRDHIATPDILLDIPPNRKLVADVKYKEKVERPDINQVVTYGCSYQVSNVVLIHQRAPSKPTGIQRLGSISGMNVFTYAFDLASSSLEVEEEAFATAILALIS